MSTKRIVASIAIELLQIIMSDRAGGRDNRCSPPSRHHKGMLVVSR